jgi:hypothetical protein
LLLQPALGPRDLPVLIRLPAFRPKHRRGASVRWRTSFISGAYGFPQTRISIQIRRIVETISQGDSDIQPRTGT